jgi:hypothetical protein
MSGYDNPITCAYRFAAAAIDTVAAVGKIVGPSGKKGRVVDVSYVVVADTTVGPTSITVGDAGDADEFATISIPVASAGAGGNGATLHAAVTGVQNEITADQVVTVTSDTGATAGDADIIVVIDWY